MPGEAPSWSGDVEVAAERFADHIACGRVIVGGSLFDRGAKVRIKSDGNDVGRSAREWWVRKTPWARRKVEDLYLSTLPPGSG